VNYCNVRINRDGDECGKPAVRFMMVTTDLGLDKDGHIYPTEKLKMWWCEGCIAEQRSPDGWPKKYLS